MLYVGNKHGTNHIVEKPNFDTVEKLQLMSHGAIGFGAPIRCWLKLPDWDHWDDNHPMF